MGAIERENSKTATAEMPAGGSWRVNFATLVGTTLEWYDFFIYGALAALVFNRVFFPSFGPKIGILLSFATFSVGFVARPLGAVIFGHYGDTRGRKNVLTATLLTMGIATILIGVLPAYQTIGILAPILLVALRFIQGIGIGGEWGGAIIMAAEHGDAKRTGLHTSWTQIGAPAGNLLSFGILTIVSSSISSGAFAEWGWRIPFVLSAAIIIVGIWIRRSLGETPTFSALQSTNNVSKFPVSELIKTYPKQLLIACFARVGADVLFYTTSLFLLSYTTSRLGLNRQIAIQAVLIGSALLLVLVPIFASLSDRIGRKAVFLVGAAACAIWIFPFFNLLQTKEPGWIMIATTVAMIFWAIMYGPIGAFIAELFPANVRYSGTSLGIQLTGIFGGGLAPLIATYLLQQFGTPIAVGIYVVVAIGISAIAVLSSTQGIHRAADGNSAIDADARALTDDL